MCVEFILPLLSVSTIRGFVAVLLHPLPTRAALRSITPFKYPENSEKDIRLLLP